MSAPSGRFYRFAVGLLLLGIFIEFLVVIGILKGEENPDGNVAIVDVIGAIDSSREIIANLKKFETKDEIKAIVLRVDSPGGTVGASQEIHDEVLRIKQTKPVVVSMGDVAASGGYYISAPSTKIIANPGTITGSLGVIATFFVFDEVLKKLNLKWEVIKAGAMKDIGSSLKSLSPQEKEILNTMIQDTHVQFIEAVANGRKMPIEKVKIFADGRIFSGRQAKEIGLVDELGSLEYAIRVAGKEAKITEKVEPVYPKEEKFSFLKNISKSLFRNESFRVGYELKP